MEYFTLCLLIVFIALAASNQQKVDKLEKEVKELKSKLHATEL